MRTTSALLLATFVSLLSLACGNEPPPNPNAPSGVGAMPDGGGAATPPSTSAAPAPSK